MKVQRIHIVFVASIFIICLFIFNINRTIKVSADNIIGFNKTPNEIPDDVVFKDEYDTFLEAYYTNLKYNTGYNHKGSCGYVALGMLLSYYDTYQSDSIIPEEYDCNSIDTSANMNKRQRSPGIYSDIIYDASTLTAEEYYEIIKERAAIDSYMPSLHAKLLTIGYDRGYYGLLSKDLPGGTMSYMVTNVLRDYLTEIGFIENTDYTLKYNLSTVSGSPNVREFVIKNIQNGKPVLIGITNGLDLGNAHYCIAYDYDEEIDEVYANFGWYGDNLYTKVSNGYSDYFFALTIDFKMEHTHTNNYGVRNADGSVDYYCWDSEEIITFHKNHKYTHHYSKCGSDEYHLAYCACGKSATQMHFWMKETNNTGIGSYVRCKSCLFLRKLRDDEAIQVPIVRHEDEYETS